MFPLCIQHICLFIHLSMNSWVAFKIQLLQIKPLWLWVFKYIFETLLLILLGIYPEVELLGYMPSLYLIFFEESPCYFPQWLYHVIVTHVVHTSSNFSTSCQQLLYCFVFDGSYLMDVKGYLIVVLICIDITISDVHLFLCVLAIWISFLRKCLFKSFAHF